MVNEKHPEPNTALPVTKKAYEKPKLIELGSVHKLTLGSGALLPDSEDGTFRD